MVGCAVEERVLIRVGQQVLERVARHQHATKPLRETEGPTVGLDPLDGKLRRQGPRAREHGGCEIDACHPQAGLGDRARQPPGPAAHVEHRAADLTR